MTNNLSANDSYTLAYTHAPRSIVKKDPTKMWDKAYSRTPSVSPSDSERSQLRTFDNNNNASTSYNTDTVLSSPKRIVSTTSPRPVPTRRTTQGIKHSPNR